jgi:hypothetical protein
LCIEQAATAYQLIVSSLPLQDIGLRANLASVA